MPGSQNPNAGVCLVELASVRPPLLINRADFEAEFRIALAETDDDFDLSRVQAVIDKWRPIAYARLNPPTEEERARIDRFHAGDDAGLLQQRDDGSWVRL